MSEIKEQFLEKVLFDIFVDCIVIKDTKLNNFDVLKDIIETTNLPIQTAHLVEKIKDNSTDFISKLSSNLYFFLFYMNYQNLYQLQYFDDKIQEWRKLTEEILSNFTEKKLLCRFISYINDELGIVRNTEFDTSLLNRYFILANE